MTSDRCFASGLLGLRLSVASVVTPSATLPPVVLRIPRPPPAGVQLSSVALFSPVTASERDLRALADIVSADRPDVPAHGGLPPSLLGELIRQIRCDVVALAGFDSGRQEPGLRSSCRTAARRGRRGSGALGSLLALRPCSYPDRTGDLRSVVNLRLLLDPAMAYHRHPVRHRPATGVCPQPDADPASRARPGPCARRTVRLIFLRESGPDFSERDRAVLTLLRPHLHQAYLDAERSRHPAPHLTPRQRDVMHLLAAGHTNAQIARRLDVSEGTVRTHLKDIYQRLNVSNRTAAVTRAFPDPAAV